MWHSNGANDDGVDYGNDGNNDDDDISEAETQAGRYQHWWVGVNTVAVLKTVVGGLPSAYSSIK